MRTLYLQENIITKIENLDSMTKLDTLNISKNFVSKIENLSHMKDLKTLIISNNNLTTAESIEHVKDIPSLNALDVQQNKIDDDPEKLLSILEACPDLRVVYLKGNDIVKKISHYRKTLISRCKMLKYLDDRPVFEDERKRCDAWGKVMKETGDVQKVRADELRQRYCAISTYNRAARRKATILPYSSAFSVRNVAAAVDSSGDNCF